MSTASKTLRALYASIPAKSTKTAHAHGADDVRLAIRKARIAKRRVRVYSDAGFVPNSYRYTCRIQYVEGVKTDAGWLFTTGWTGAQRSGGRGELLVVQ